MGRVKHYDQSVKEHAVKLSYEKGSIMNAARELDISYSSIIRWRKEFARKTEGSVSQTPIEQPEGDVESAAMGACILFRWLWPFW